MKTDNRQLTPGSYRLVKGVRIAAQGNTTYAICDYPMRVVRLTPTITALLSLCVEEQTCEQLAHHLEMPVKRVEMLCDQLRWKMLLEAGPMLPPSTWPLVSIVIPTYNRARELERCLRSLFELDYPTGSIEIIVVDDGSTDNTHAVVQPMILEAEALGMELRIVRHEKQQGVAISRNTGAQAAKHDLMAYLDSDCVASPTWLTELVPAFKDARIAAVGGMIRAYERGSMLGRYEDTRSSLFMGRRAQQICLEGPLTYLPTASLLIRRTIWQQLGGFAPLTFGEDVDFCRRLLATGARILYLPQGIVYHDYRTTLVSFLRTRVAYASAEAALLQRHPTERRTLLLPPEQATFAGFLLAGLWGLLWQARGPRRPFSTAPCPYNASPKQPGAIVDRGNAGASRLPMSHDDAGGGFREGCKGGGQAQGPHPATAAAPCPYNTSPKQPGARLDRGDRRGKGRGRAYKGRFFGDQNVENPLGKRVKGDLHTVCEKASPLASQADLPEKPTLVRRWRGWEGASRLPTFLMYWQRQRSSLIFSLFLLAIAIMIALVGACTRLYKVRSQENIPVDAPMVARATLRGHLSYTYHLCRHFTRYYTLPLLIASIVIPPLLLLLCVLYGIVIGVDYVRLRPDLGLSEYVLCSVLDDCAYEVGVVWGCIKFRTWKPLFPIAKRRM